jgi:molybdopterin converting factor small subunit
MTPNATTTGASPGTANRGGTAEGAVTETTVRLRACGRFRRPFDEPRTEFTFEGDSLREFVGALLGRRPELTDLLVGETDRGEDAGWTELRDATGDAGRPFVRVMVNGTFNECLDGADTELSDGDRVELVEPLTV